MADRIGDAPIEPHLRATMNGIARALDEVLNGEAKGKDRKTGFVLLAFPMRSHEGRCNYISNADRADIVVLLKEQLARFEGYARQTGHA